MSKHRHCPRTIKAARVQVRCSGAMHTIELRPSGRLVFHDHDWRELALETELRKSANLPPGCRCEVILRQWRGDWVSGRIERETGQAGIPVGMPDKLTKARDGIDYRKHQRCEVDLSPWNGNEWRHRLMRRTQAAAEAALSLANYRRSRSSWAGGDHETSVLVYRRTTPNIEGRAVKAWSRNGRWSGNTSKITATVRASWVVRVAKIGGGSGLVADKNGDSLFVLDVLREHDMVFVRNGRSLRKPGQVVALVGRQGRGFDVTARPALVDAATGVIVRWETKAAQIEPIAEAA